jgi:hypothetical protein
MSGKRGWRSGCATRCDDPTSAGFESTLRMRGQRPRSFDSLVKITGALQAAAKAITMASVATIVPALPVAARSRAASRATSSVTSRI